MAGLQLIFYLDQGRRGEEGHGESTGGAEGGGRKQGGEIPGLGKKMREEIPYIGGCRLLDT